MFYDTHNKTECFGCEACIQVCPPKAIHMEEDTEGFRYPKIDEDKCISCNACKAVCPYEHNFPVIDDNDRYVFGGYNLDPKIRFESTSGGAFSAIADAFCDRNYVLFGARAKGISVFHDYTEDKSEISGFRKSKYSQSVIGDAYKKAGVFLVEGKKVLFSGTPCQIAGLLSYLDWKGVGLSNLLTVDVVCEGVPSPLYIRKLNAETIKRYGTEIETLDYRYTGKSILGNGTWDFQKMRLVTGNKTKILARWFNPFWSVWLQHLMSRPSCYKCPFATPRRISDITLGDLWGVHIFCPDLYGKNGGASLVICNTKKGCEVFRKTVQHMYGHELEWDEVLKCQGALRGCIKENPQRKVFIHDLQKDMSYHAINKKWAKPPSLRLLFSKYVWGNRQKVLLWRLRTYLFDRDR